MICNLDRINKSVQDRNLRTPWVEILTDIFNPGHIPPPILLRPIVDDVVTRFDVDLVYPVEWLDDFLEHIYSISNTYSLHIFSRAYDRHKVLVRLYDLYAESSIAFDIQVKVYQLDSAKHYITWSHLYPRARKWNALLEADAISGALVYLPHLIVQRKDLQSESVKARSGIYLERLESIDSHDSKHVEVIRKLLADRTLLKDRNTFNKLKQIATEYLCPDVKQNDWAIIRYIQKKIGKYYLFYTVKPLFVGADGSGKNTLMTNVNSKAKVITNMSTYNDNVIYNNAKRRVRWKPECSQASDIYPRYFFILSFLKTLLLTLIHIRKVVFFDRSPSDILITNRKTDNISLCPSAYKLQKIARGMLTIHITGYNAELFENPRKEMTSGQITTYNNLMFSLTTRYRPFNYLFFRNFYPLDKSVNALKCILRDGEINAVEIF